MKTVTIKARYTIQKDNENKAYHEIITHAFDNYVP